jgi:hypothetical protein
LPPFAKIGFGEFAEFEIFEIFEAARETAVHRSMLTARCTELRPSAGEALLGGCRSAVVLARIAA